MLIYTQKNEILFELEFIKSSETPKKSLYIYHYLYQNSWHLDLRTLLLASKYLEDDDIELHICKRVGTSKSTTDRSNTMSTMRKSDVVRQIAKESGIELIDLPLAAL